MSTLTINRRQLIAGMSASLGVLALRGFEVSASQGQHFTHGVASGDPLSDRVILWTRVIPGNGQHGVVQCRWQVATDDSFRTIVSSGQTTTSAEGDYTVKVDATGLTPGTGYYYRFLSDGAQSATGRTSTLPEGDITKFRMGVTSCSNYPQGYFNAYRDMANSELDLVVHLGDYIYEYPEGVYSNPVALDSLGRHVKPETEVLNLEDYRMRYGLYRNDTDLQALHARYPFVCVWDDHELTNNTWRDGAENHNDGEGDFAVRMHYARKAYHEWIPIRTENNDQEPIYRNFSIGKLADLTMLDTRLHGRDRQLKFTGPIEEVNNFFQEELNDPHRTILGKDQEQWLAQTLKQSKQRNAPWQLIGQQVLIGKVNIPKIDDADLDDSKLSKASKDYFQYMRQLAETAMPFNMDAWDGYPACRERIFEELIKHANNPVVLAGDTHNAWAFNLRDADQQPVGIEIGTPGVTSPGMESFLPMSPAVLARDLKASSPELYAVDTARRGWAELTLTPEEVTNQWHFVSTILSREFEVTHSELHRCKAGDRRFS